MDAVEELGAFIEKMTFSARSKQTTLLDHAFEGALALSEAYWR